MNAKKRFLFKWTNLLFAVLIALGGIFSVVSPGLAWAPSLNMNCIEIRASSGSFREKFYMDSQISKVSSEGPWVDLPRLWAKQRRNGKWQISATLQYPNGYIANGPNTIWWKALSVGGGMSVGQNGSASFTCGNPPPPPENKPPVCKADGNPKEGDKPLKVNFTGEGSYDPDGSIASYSWAFGNGETGNGKETSTTYTAAGDYNATLTVTDNEGKSASCSVPIKVKNPQQSKTAEEQPWCPWDLFVTDRKPDDGSSDSDIIVRCLNRTTMVPVAERNITLSLGPGEDTHPSLSLDGRIVWSRKVGTNPAVLWVANYDGTEAISLEIEGMQPSWAKDPKVGDTIAFVDSTFVVKVYNLTTKTFQSFGSGEYPDLDGNGQLVFSKNNTVAFGATMSSTVQTQAATTFGACITPRWTRTGSLDCVTSWDYPQVTNFDFSSLQTEVISGAIDIVRDPVGTTWVGLITSNTGHQLVMRNLATGEVSFSSSTTMEELNPDWYSPTRVEADTVAFQTWLASPQSFTTAPDNGKSSSLAAAEVYKGSSLVEYLVSINQNASFETRAQLAATNGIQNYLGTSEQNTALLKILRG